jgi:MGT family glycosyltransferase
MRITPAPASFRDPTVPVTFDLHHVRPPILDEPSSLLNGRPTVYATLGTVFDVESGDLFERLALGLAATGADALLTVGHHFSPLEFLPHGDHRVRIEPFVAQRNVLLTSRAVVCHGGSGTAIAALAHGVPLVVLPMGADQPDNADRIQDLGVGVVLDAVTATATDIAGALREVLEDPSYTGAARRIAAESAAQPPLSAMADLLMA